MWGKFKTVFQIIAILLFIVKGSDALLALHPDMELALYVISWFFMIVALVLTVVSMVDYFMKCAPILGFGNAGSKKDSDDFSCSPKAVIDRAIKEGKHLSTAESCTGGLIGGALTGVPGSSAVVEGGIISYSNDVKINVLAFLQPILSGLAQ